MCRLMAYCGPQILIADVVLWPSRSIIKQSYDARERLSDSSLPLHLSYGNLNGDGFGIGWYSPPSAHQNTTTPCVFTSVTPAWNNDNLSRLACRLESGLIFAHVRAAYPGMPVSEQNCHPFQWGRYLFMHNGVVAGFMQIRRKLLAQLSDAAYNAVQSFHSDSAISFGLFLNSLPDMHAPQAPEVMLKAIQATIAIISKVQKEAGISDTSLLNYVVSDGSTLVATRFVSNDEDAAASLYFAEGSAYERTSTAQQQVKRTVTAAPEQTLDGAAGARSKSVTGEGDYHLCYGELGTRVCLIASEPVTGALSDWAEVPRNTALVVCREKAGVLNVVQSPLTAEGVHPRQEEVSRCIEAVARASGLTATANLAAPPANLPGPSLSAPILQTHSSIPSRMDSEGDSPAGSRDVSPSRLPRGTPSGGLPAHGGGGRGRGRDRGTGPAVVVGEEHRLTGHSGTVMALAASDMGLLFSGSTDNTIKVWRLSDCKLVATLEGHRNPIRRLEVHGAFLYSQGAKTVRVWELAGFTCVGVVQVADISGSMKAMAVGPGGLLYVGGQDCKVKAYRLTARTPAPSPIVDEVAVAAAHAEAGRTPSQSPLTAAVAALVGAAPGLAGGAGLANGSKRAPVGHPADARPAAAAAKGSGLALLPPGCKGLCVATVACGGGGAASNGLSRQQPEREAAEANGECSSPTFLQSTDRAVCRACIHAAEQPSAQSGCDHSHCSSVTALALCGEYVCSASTDSTIRVWTAETLEFVRVLRGHRGSVLALHGAGGLLLSGGRDHLIRVWDSETLVCRRTLSGHTDDVLSITGITVPLSDPASEGLADLFSPTVQATPASGPSLGSTRPSSASSAPAVPAVPAVPAGERPLLFASGSADGTVRLWSAHCWSCIRVFRSTHAPTLQPPVLSCAMSESWAAAGMPDGIVRLFSIDDAYARAVQLLYGLADCGADSHQSIVVPLSPVTAKGCDEGGQPVTKKARFDGAAGGRAGAALAPVVTSRLERELERALRTFIRIKTVSADPSLHEECFRGAKFLLRLLEGLGAEVKLCQPVEDKNPLVLARLGRDPAKPTVTFYGHYDVQPALEPEWKTNPFEVNAVDGHFYGRGVSDNKGPVLAFIYSVKELLEECKQPSRAGCLPVNVVFLLEGEEENGSIGFREAVQQNLPWFEGTKLVLISNTLWVGESKPCITYGMRGMISLSVEVKGPARDLHSGNEGGVFCEPLIDLNKVLASLVDSRSNIQVPGFYSGVRPNMLSCALQRLQGCHEFSLEGYKEALGVPYLTTGRSEADLLNSRWCLPSISVVDVRVGTTEEGHDHYRFGPTRFSVIPRAAVGKVSVRFVPNQDAQHLVECLTAHMQHEFAKLRSGNELSVKVHSIGDWWEADPDSPLMRLAERAVQQEWGTTPLLVREGGTMPVASALEKLLGAPSLLLPMGQSSDNCHLANERLGRANLLKGKNVVKHLLAELGAQAKQAGCNGRH